MWFVLVVAIFVLVFTVFVALSEAQEKFPGEQQGVPLPGEWDKANWSWQQHCWYLVHRFSDAIIPLITVGAAGAGGMLWKRKASQKSS
jgi:Na+/proline symporter